MISAAWGGLTSLDDLAILRLVLEAAQASSASRASPVRKPAVRVDQRLVASVRGEHLERRVTPALWCSAAHTEAALRPQLHAARTP